MDEIIWEPVESEDKAKETYQSFPVLKARLHSFLKRSIDQLSSLVRMYCIVLNTLHAPHPLFDGLSSDSDINRMCYPSTIFCLF